MQDRKGKVGVLNEEIKELNFAIDQLKNEGEALRNEIKSIDENLVNKSDTYETQSKYYEDQLYVVKSDLKSALAALTETQNKDKAFREGIAEEKLALDKRTEVVKRMEGRLAESEARIEELSRFDHL